MIATTITIVKKSSIFTVITILLIITGCASVQVSSVKTSGDYNKVWKACIDSLSDVRFSASSTDPVSGLIIADQAVLGGHGTVSRLNIQVSKESGSTIVVVKFVPPPGTMGGGGIVGKYVEALKQRIPDLDVK